MKLLPLSLSNESIRGSAEKLVEKLLNRIQKFEESSPRYRRRLESIDSEKEQLKNKFRKLSPKLAESFGNFTNEVRKGLASHNDALGLPEEVADHFSDLEKVINSVSLEDDQKTWSIVLNSKLEVPFRVRPLRYVLDPEESDVGEMNTFYYEVGNRENRLEFRKYPYDCDGCKDVANALQSISGSFNVSSGMISSSFASGDGRMPRVFLSEIVGYYELLAINLEYLRFKDLQFVGKVGATRESGSVGFRATFDVDESKATWIRPLLEGILVYAEVDEKKETLRLKFEGENSITLHENWKIEDLVGTVSSDLLSIEGKAVVTPFDGWDLELEGGFAFKSDGSVECSLGVKSLVYASLFRFQSGGRLTLFCGAQTQN